MQYRRPSAIGCSLPRTKMFSQLSGQVSHLDFDFDFSISQKFDFQQKGVTPSIRLRDSISYIYYIIIFNKKVKSLVKYSKDFFKHFIKLSAWNQVKSLKKEGWDLTFFDSYFQTLSSSNHTFISKGKEYGDLFSRVISNSTTNNLINYSFQPWPLAEFEACRLLSIVYSFRFTNFPCGTHWAIILQMDNSILNCQWPTLLL